MTAARLHAEYSVGGAEQARFIPEALRQLDQWVCWRYEQRDGKSTKVPFDPRKGWRASSTDPSTWTTFARAWGAREHYDGVGFVLAPGGGLFGVDLDHCLDEAGEPAEWAADIVAALETYTEITPSGAGLRLFAFGQLPPGGRKRGPVEVYDQGRFLTVTGRHLEGTRWTLEERTAQVAAFHAQFFPSPAEPASRNGSAPPEALLLDDQELLRRAEAASNGSKFAALWRGDTSGYGSASEADLALASYLAFWTSGHVDRMDRLFRQSSLYREKWDSRRGASTYGEQTLAHAAATVGSFYGDNVSPNGHLDSVPPIGDGAGRKRIGGAERWVPKPLSTLSGEDDTEPWVWDGYIRSGVLMLLTGLWKAGKTTLIAHLLRELGTGGTFGGRKVVPARVLVVSEEAEVLWAKRRDALELRDHVAVICRPFLGRADGRAWVALVERVAALVCEQGYSLVVFDSLPHLWPVTDENKPSDILAALVPLYAITGAGAGVLLAMHPKKGDAGEGQATRGSGAITAFVDVIVELRRFDPERRDDTRRVLTAYSRFEETPPEVVLEYDSLSGYRAVGSKSDARSEDRLSVVTDVVPATAPGWTVDDILNRWPNDAGITKPGERTLRRDLDGAVARGRLSTSGAGVRGDPLRYFLAPDSFPASSTPIGGNES